MEKFATAHRYISLARRNIHITVTDVSVLSIRTALLISYIPGVKEKLDLAIGQVLA